MNITFNFANGTSWVTFWAAIAATASGIGAAITAWINWNNRIDASRPEIIISGCEFDKHLNFTIGELRNIGTGPALQIQCNIYFVNNDKGSGKFEFNPLFPLGGIVSYLANGQSVDFGAEFGIQRVLSDVATSGYFEEKTRNNARSLLETLKKNNSAGLAFLIEYLDSKNYTHYQQIILVLLNEEIDRINQGYKSQIGEGVYLGMQNHSRRKSSDKSQLKRMSERVQQVKDWSQRLDG